MNQQTEFQDVQSILFKEAQPLSASKYPIPELKTETLYLKKGSIQKKGAHPLKLDMEVLKDQPIPMRDGIRLYADVY